MVNDSVCSCSVCGVGGVGNEFPLWPLSGARFGTICVSCDKDQKPNRRVLSHDFNELTREDDGYREDMEQGRD